MYPLLGNSMAQKKKKRFWVKSPVLFLSPPEKKLEFGFSKNVQVLQKGAFGG